MRVIIEILVLEDMKDVKDVEDIEKNVEELVVIVVKRKDTLLNVVL